MKASSRRATEPSLEIFLMNVSGIKIIGMLVETCLAPPCVTAMRRMYKFSMAKIMSAQTKTGCERVMNTRMRPLRRRSLTVSSMIPVTSTVSLSVLEQKVKADAGYYGDSDKHDRGKQKTAILNAFDKNTIPVPMNALSSMKNAFMFEECKRGLFLRPSRGIRSPAVSSFPSLENGSSNLAYIFLLARRVL